MKKKKKKKKKFNLPRGYYTTGQAARKCGVSQQTIIRAYDAGILNGFKVPHSHHRRIKGESMRKYIKENHLPVADFAY